MLSFAVLALCAALSSHPATPPFIGSGALSGHSAAELLESPERHVRTVDPHVQALLADGLAHSPTFGALVARLNASDVIVYIQPVPALPATLAGRLMLLPIPEPQRYLRIQIRDDRGRREAIAIIAHELRHAVEVADAPDVRDDAAMRRLYERIGQRSVAPDGHRFETAAARQAADRVRRELA